MAALWKENYKLGIDQLDQQHKQLIMTTEELLATLKTAPPDEKLRYKQILGYVKDYARVHFGAEELHMQAIGYAGLEEHRALHRGFVDTLHSHELRLIQTDYNRAEARRLAELLTRWWIYHIMREDKKFVPDTAQKTAAGAL